MFKEGNLRLVRTPQARWDVRAVQCRAQGSDDGGIVVRVVGNMLSERGIEPVCEAWLAEGMSTREGIWCPHLERANFTRNELLQLRKRNTRARLLGLLLFPCTLR